MALRVSILGLLAITCGSVLCLVVYLLVLVVL